MPQPVKNIDVNYIIDNAGMLGLPLIVTLCTNLILILDGLDIQLISLVAPQVSQEFILAPAELGPVLAAALLGMAVGGFALGGLGDRWGRRPALLISVALFAASTLMGATIQSISMLTVWRLLTGIGLGGAVPNAMALAAEFTNPRWRTRAIAAACIGVPVGGMSGAAIAAYVLPHMGWRTMFVIGGVLPLAVLAVTYIFLPESPRFLATRPKRRKALIDMLNRLAGSKRYTTADEFELPPQVIQRTGVAALFAEPFLRDTCGLWFIFSTNLFVAYTFFSWAPVILSSFGLPLSVAIRGSIVFNLAGVCGGATTGWLLSRSGSRWPTATLAALAIATLGFISRLLSHAAQMGTPVNVAALMAAIAVVGFAMIGIQTAAYRLSTHLYPTEVRSSGIGWAAGFGRIGGILSSLIAGWLLTRVHGAGLFAVLSCVVALTLLGVLSIRRHLAPLASTTP